MLPVYARAIRGVLPGGRKQSSAHTPSRTVTTTHHMAAEAVAGFQRVLGARVQDRVPAAYLHVLGFPSGMRLMTDPGFPLPVLGMVHVENTFRHLRPVSIGDTVRVDVKLGRLREHPKGTTVTLEVTGVREGAVADGAGGQGSSGAGETVFEEVVTYLAKGTTLPGVAPALPGERTDFTAPDVPHALWKLAPEIGPRYAAVSGDHNPIHLNSVAAKAFGFPRTIAHGVYTAARGLEASGALPDAFEWTVQFAKPVVLPATVAFGSWSAVGRGTGVADAASTGSDSASGGPLSRDYAVWNPKNGKPHVVSHVAGIEVS